MNELRTYVSLAQDLRSGKITPRAYLEECLDRIAKNEPRIGAFVMSMPTPLAKRRTLHPRAGRTASRSLRSTASRSP